MLRCFLGNPWKAEEKELGARLWHQKTKPELLDDLKGLGIKLGLESNKYSHRQIADRVATNMVRQKREVDESA